ncbi:MULTISPECIES: Uma2 family endonuclease [unclassified Streptomyces]|uniref:Uma2 family endonuclease n=1 Tax=unclassified Streptomyces TaxID=2593676 RepID=UPI0019040D94|nr:MULTISPECIES: Uma2 family endonuclease [unclassified Streptomyces]MCU4746819.1 Uma2 family endonuclease [Streptomyces sp. G-5]QQN77524.1 Uma2 family endonuclease [Streptomyces sp. XC 2026]
MTVMSEESIVTMSPIANPHELLRFLEEVPELDELKIELIDGKIVLRASATPFYNRIVRDLGSQFQREDWEALPEQAVISPDSSFEPKPDLSVTTLDAIADNPNPLPCHSVDLVVEVVSGDRDVDQIKKLFWYGTSKVPLYLIVDPNDGLSHLHAKPYGRGYRTRTTTEFGRPVELPEPFGFALDTTGFKIYPPRRPTR